MAGVGGQVRRGGRTEKNRQAVADAVLSLLRVGNINFELQEVAALSGVHRTTIYRRWPERSDLIAEAMSENASRISVEFTGDWEVDLRCIAYKMRDWQLDPFEMAVNRLLAVTDDQEVFDHAVKHWPPILKRFGEPIRDAQARGLLDESIDSELVISALVSTILANTLFLRVRPSDEFLDRLIAQLVRGCPAAEVSDSKKRVISKKKSVASVPKKKTASKKARL